MMDVLAHEPAIRLSAFLGVLLVVAACEARAPKREQTVSRRTRWPHNLGLAALNTLIVRGALPLTAVGLAALAEARGWGLLSGRGSLPGWVVVLVSVAALDLAIYLQHVLFHAVPVLWRLHRMHHADLDFDVTTGVRFHPLEILLSLLYKLALIVALGSPALAVMLFEVLLNAGSLFNHANLRLPASVDRVLRRLVVTPDMHRVHHSALSIETNSNFGFTFPWWDWLCGTYRAQPAAGHDAMTIGLEAFRDPRCLRLDQLLIQPLLGSPGPHAITGRRMGP
jgi:sterol desaturase/sphingolipid hydroxylase (fatty acid hydroxylase superfamily)